MFRHALRRSAATALALILSLAALVVAAAGPAAAAADWSTAGSLATARYYHSATALSDGRVLVTGGRDNTVGALASAEVYDPTSDTWSPAGSLATARFHHAATARPDGTVLVTGGYHSSVRGLAASEVYEFVATETAADTDGDASTTPPTTAPPSPTPASPTPTGTARATGASHGTPAPSPARSGT